MDCSGRLRCCNHVGRRYPTTGLNPGSTMVVLAEASKVPPRLAAPRLAAGVILLLAGLAALSSLATNIILPSFPSIGGALGVTTRELAVTLSSFFVAFALG